MKFIIQSCMLHEHMFLSWEHPLWCLSCIGSSHCVVFAIATNHHLVWLHDDVTTSKQVYYYRNACIAEQNRYRVWNQRDFYKEKLEGHD